MGMYNIHNDFKKYEKFKIPLSPALLPLVNTFLAGIFKLVKPAKGVSAAIKKIPVGQNGMIQLTIFEPENIGDNAPCLIYLHGGAFALKAAPYHKKLVCEYAVKTPCKVVFVDYRLAPEYTFPIGVEDCYAAFEWVCKNAEALAIDKDRIAIGGDSAGGALTAAVCLMARDKNAPGICFQMLIYPVTDARQITESMNSYTDTPLWNSKLNQKMWKLYFGDEVDCNREYASPLETVSLGNLPDAYVEVSEFDCLRDEGIQFAEALKKSGIHVDLHQIAGTMHGFDIAAKSEIVRQSVTRRIEALKSAFNANKA